VLTRSDGFNKKLNKNETRDSSVLQLVKPFGTFESGDDTNTVLQLERTDTVGVQGQFGDENGR
jgi:hypothetical protein